MMLRIGQRVRATRDITEAASDELPAQHFADKGTPLIVHSLGGTWDLYVTNPEFKPETPFGVRASEVEPIE